MPYLNETELVRFRASINEGLVTEEDRNKLNSISGLKNGANCEIQYGRAVAASVAANGFCDIALAYDPEFSSRPYLVATLSSRGHTDKVRISAYSESKAQGAIRIKNDASSAIANVSIDWLAVR